MEQKIEIQMLQWGPCVVKLKIQDHVRELLLQEGKKSKEDYRTKLAGILDHETGYGEESKKKIIPYLSQYLGVYDQGYEKFKGKKYDKRPEYVVSALWCNFQRQHEFNPPHDHDGRLSFVIYLQIPDELKKEHKEYVGKSCGPGGIQFVYGDGNRDAITYQSHFPEEGDMFIFPAWLKHWVAPFKSDVERISVSGNVHDSAPLNNIEKVAPLYTSERDRNMENEEYLKELKKKI
jgi:hypothetical protein|tara:strand:- start:113 stop:814 length:702 start_codon:yes stop_codon:yes gene_type:complete